jgi:hypothetical protein
VPPFRIIVVGGHDRLALLAAGTTIWLIGRAAVILDTAQSGVGADAFVRIDGDFAVMRLVSTTTPMVVVMGTISSLNSLRQRRCGAVDAHAVFVLRLLSRCSLILCLGGLQHSKSFRFVLTGSRAQ